MMSVNESSADSKRRCYGNRILSSYESSFKLNHATEPTACWDFRWGVQSTITSLYREMVPFVPKNPEATQLFHFGYGVELFEMRLQSTVIKPQLTQAFTISLWIKPPLKLFSKVIAPLAGIQSEKRESHFIGYYFNEEQNLVFEAHSTGHLQPPQIQKPLDIRAFNEHDNIHVSIVWQTHSIVVYVNTEIHLHTILSIPNTLELYDPHKVFIGGIEACKITMVSVAFYTYALPKDMLEILHKKQLVHFTRVDEQSEYSFPFQLAALDPSKTKFIHVQDPRSEEKSSYITCASREGPLTTKRQSSANPFPCIRRSDVPVQSVPELISGVIGIGSLSAHEYMFCVLIDNQERPTEFISNMDGPYYSVPGITLTSSPSSSDHK
jgi:hypothetical protein